MIPYIFLEKNLFNSIELWLYNNHNDYRGAEGKTVEVTYRGKADDTIKDILSDIRSACTYVGANRLKTLSKCTTFVRVNNTHNTIYGNE